MPADRVSTARPVDRELRRLLRQGTFAQVLDHCLNVRGLSLKRLQDDLEARGAHMSRAALSYWRNGQCRPERDESLRAVRALEELFGLPESALVSLLGPPRPRGRGAEPGSVDRKRMWPGHDPLVASLAVSADEGLRHLSVHEDVRVGADRRLAEVSTRMVVEAARDHVDRCLVYQWVEESELPELAASRFCRPGRTRRDETAGATVCELVLDQRLMAGERTVVEFTWKFAGGPELTHYHRRFTRPVRELVLQVEFTGPAPANCVPYRQRTPADPARRGHPLWIGLTGAAHLVVEDVRPGIAGLSWEWD
ncbi:XRE family transcriptional regulator [Amycolatopsis sp. PS_44_ISF1]|uniref:XRE family transcriptional regulator n=1 Tax=Amycolatopsis sp. PS_44_ISF1 TaxID=2974917 RepID=UPI0028E022F1|nr:XRE family transcriptional regulator [Amycolatopsis sp. PS_44_ISF1]MDT8915181.1 XRE family transcriptional regulator [Amycolatopsis sp. PS_44_ISF1]